MIPSAFHHPTKTGQPFIPQPAHVIAQRVILNDHETMCFVTGDEAGVVVYERDEEQQAFGDLPAYQGNADDVVFDAHYEKMRRPIASEDNAILDRYLKLTGLTPHSILQFYVDGTGDYHAIIHPYLAFTGRYLGFKTYPHVGCTLDMFSADELAIKEKERKV